MVSSNLPFPHIGNWTEKAYLQFVKKKKIRSKFMKPLGQGVLLSLLSRGIKVVDVEIYLPL